MRPMNLKTRGVSSPRPAPVLSGEKTEAALPRIYFKRLEEPPSSLLRVAVLIRALFEPVNLFPVFYFRPSKILYPVVALVAV